MILTQSVLALVLLESTSVAARSLASRSAYAVKDSHPVPRQWSVVAAAPKAHMLQLDIALKQGQFDKLDQELMQVSDPSHDRYGQHLSMDQVHSLVKPTSETTDQVHQWLVDNGFKPEDLTSTPAGDWISVKMPVEKAESLLKTKFSVYGHKDGTKFIRAPEWSLPEHLHEHVDTIQPTSSFFRPRSTAAKDSKAQTLQRTRRDATRLRLKARNDTNGCDEDIVTPTCLRNLYGTIDYKPQSQKSHVGICNYLGETGNRSDTRLFIEQQRPDAVGAADTFKIESVNGGEDNQGPLNATQIAGGTGIEGDLDIQTVIAITHPISITEYNTGGQPPYVPDQQNPENNNEPYHIWLNYILASQDLPQVISNSYADDEQTLPYDYAKRVCDGFAQLGARGVSVFFGSGDRGVGADGDCVTNDGKNTSTFLAMFPASCPYVTTVGGTKGFNPEVVADDPTRHYSSGGGFSRYFPRPSYQDAAVQPFLDGLKGQYADLFNASGRGYPDLAASSQHYPTVWNGKVRSTDGTSASTPLVASIFALVNDALMADGKPPLGFLNPWLYQKGFQGLTDITSGSTKGCNTTGFPAVQGWDAVTGFGTPSFPKLKDLASQ